jgi:hypothetical protein
MWIEHPIDELEVTLPNGQTGVAYRGVLHVYHDSACGWQPVFRETQLHVQLDDEINRSVVLTIPSTDAMLAPEWSYIETRY